MHNSLYTDKRGVPPGQSLLQRVMRCKVYVRREAALIIRASNNVAFDTWRAELKPALASPLVQNFDFQRAIGWHPWPGCVHVVLSSYGTYQLAHTLTL